MARQPSVSVENNFMKGMVTEFSGLNFPENACSDALNCYFDDTGRVRRRLGIDYEDSYTLIDTPITTNTRIYSFYWQNVAGDASKNYAVFQIGNTLEFFSVTGDANLSDHRAESFAIDLSVHRVSGAPSISDEYCQFAQGHGRLYVAHPYCEPFYVYYDETTNDLLTEQIEIKIRDFTILDDGQPKADKLIEDKNAQAEYNLKNQGWDQKYLDAWQQANDDGTWPAKSMLWWYFRIPAGEEQSDENAEQGGGIKGLDFKAGRRNRFSTAGNSFAPRGYFILDAFYQDRGTEIGADAPSAVVTAGYRRPSTVCFMNSRVFYSGVNADKYSNTIYFSNIIRDVDQPMRFYQNADPTSEISYELLPNDGGTIVIPEAGQIIWIRQIADQLLVLCNNGVWTVTGSEGIGFTATDYTVNKISEVGVISALSVVIAEGTPFWWNNEGIWTLSPKEGVVSITKPTIQSFYEDISINSKRFAKGAFNPLTREIHWVYSSGDNPRDYNSVITFRTTSGAFYPYRFPSNATVCDIISIGGQVGAREQSVVTDNSGVNVLDINGDQVVIDIDTIAAQASVVKYLVRRNGQYTFAEFKNTNYVDWASAVTNGVEYSSYFITGYRLKGEANRRFSTPYIHVFTDTEETASCYMSGMWDWATATNTGRINNSQQVYGPYNSGFYMGVRKLKVRGSGLALQLKFESEEDKPFSIVGWATFDTSNERV